MLTGLQFDIIFTNLDEGGLLSGELSPDAVADRLLDLSPLVVLKLDAEGCLVATREGQQHIPAASALAVVDATGAGDAFAAAFLVEYLKSRNIREAAVAANALAAKVVGTIGAR